MKPAFFRGLPGLAGLLLLSFSASPYQGRAEEEGPERKDSRDGSQPKERSSSKPSKDGFDPSTLDRSNPEEMRRKIKEYQEKTLNEAKKKMAKAEADGTIIVHRKEGGKESTSEPAEENSKAPKRRVVGREPTGTAGVVDGRIFDPTYGLAPAQAQADLDPPKKGSLMDRMGRTLAAKRLQPNGEPGPYAPANATLVELDIEKPLLPNRQEADVRARSVVFVTEPPKPVVPENIEELKEEAERRFKEGLGAKDTVIRDWSFRYGTAYRRPEAIPFMVRELRNEGWLSTLAAVGLGQIGEAQREAVDALQGGLTSKEAGVRQACAHSLGLLRVSSAVRPMAKIVRNERNFQVRVACYGAMGLIGDRDAVGVLKQALNTPDEVQMVKAEAALALARLGERAGSAFLEECFAQPAPQIQLLGLLGLIELRGPALPACLVSALGARYDEVWLTAVRALPTLGAGMVQPTLREALGSHLPYIRHRAALALGLMGDLQALPYIQQALLEGDLAERQLAAELLGLLGHRESIPLLMERVREPTSSVRMAAALALVRLDAKEALPALVEAVRGSKANPELAISRGPVDVQETMLLLGCIRTLKGEEGSREFATLPEKKSSRWPEFEKELEKYQFDVLRGYHLVEVMGATDRPVAVVLKDSQGREQTYRENEAVAFGFRVHEMRMGRYGVEAGADAAWVVLQRGGTRCVLLGNGRVEFSEVKSDKKPLADHP